MSSYSHASNLTQTRQGLRLLGEHEAGICDQVGHELRPVAGGRIACVCCGAEHIAPPLIDDEPNNTCGGSGEIHWNPSKSAPKDPQIENSHPCPGCSDCTTPGTKREDT